MKFSSLAALEVVLLTTSSAASDENFIKMKTFLLQCITCYCIQYNSEKVETHKDVKTSHILAMKTSHILAMKTSHILAMNTSHILAMNTSHILAMNTSHILAMNTSHILAMNTSHILAMNRSHILPPQANWGFSHEYLCYHIKAKTKWPLFRRWHFQCIILNEIFWILIKFHWNINMFLRV